MMLQMALIWSRGSTTAPGSGWSRRGRPGCLRWSNAPEKRNNAGGPIEWCPRCWKHITFRNHFMRARMSVGSTVLSEGLDTGARKVRCVPVRGPFHPYAWVTLLPSNSCLPAVIYSGTKSLTSVFLPLSSTFLLLFLMILARHCLSVLVEPFRFRPVDNRKPFIYAAS